MGLGVKASFRFRFRSSRSTPTLAAFHDFPAITESRRGKIEDFSCCKDPTKCTINQLRKKRVAESKKAEIWPGNILETPSVQNPDQQPA